MRQPHHMVKHTQTICRLSSTNSLSLSDHYMGLVLKGLKALQDLYDVIHFKGC